MARYPEVGDILEQRYRIEAEIGRGGMGRVFRAWDLKKQRTVALKVLKEEIATHNISYFQREIEATMRLKHPNIVRVYDYNLETEPPYLVMEYIEGESLEEYLQREGRLPLEKVVAIVRDIAVALDAIHTQQIVHRDIKPSNIMLATDGRAILLDFGVARLMEGYGYGSFTENVGTPRYMAPEQFRGDQITRMTDIYALGLTTYRMLTGRFPFEAKSPYEWMRCHIEKPPAPLPPDLQAAYPRLQAVLWGALEKYPGARHASAGAFARALARVLEEKRAPTSSSGGRTPTPAPPTPHPTRPESQIQPPPPPPRREASQTPPHRTSHPPRRSPARRRSSSKRRLSPRYAFLSGLVGIIALVLVAVLWFLFSDTQATPSGLLPVPTIASQSSNVQSRLPSITPTSAAPLTSMVQGGNETAINVSIPTFTPLLATATPLPTPTPLPTATPPTTSTNEGIGTSSSSADTPAISRVHLRVPGAEQNMRYSVPFEWDYPSKWLPDGFMFRIELESPTGNVFVPPSCVGKHKVDTIWHCIVPPEEIGKTEGEYRWRVILLQDGKIVGRTESSLTFTWRYIQD